MKIRRLLLLLVTTGNCCVLLAQQKKHEISLSVFYDRVNQDYINFEGVSKEKMLYKNGISITANYNYYLNANLSIQSGLGISQRGFKTEYEDYSFNYFQIPIHLRLNAVNSRNMSLMPYAGTYFGIPSNVEKKIKNDTFEIDNKNIDCGLEIGINTSFKISQEYGFSIIPRLQYGLTKAYQEDYYESRRNIAFSLGVGAYYKFN